jgi:deoxyribodipyrimidine photo-lyase
VWLQVDFVKVSETISRQINFHPMCKKHFIMSIIKDVDIMVKSERIRVLKEKHKGTGPVIYWMSRDQRISDNWALIYAQEVAVARNEPLAVVFCVVPEFLNAAMRQYKFMFAGLQEVEHRLSILNIPFFLLQGQPEKEIPAFVSQWKSSILVTDFDPLRIKRRWKDAVAHALNIPFYEVDAHNIVPCWVASPKQEYGAYTIRPKINRLLSEFLEDYPKPKKHLIPWSSTMDRAKWDEVERNLTIDRKIHALSWLEPGEKAAQSALKRFIAIKLSGYDSGRNDPNKAGQSDLSPYLHFGHISAQRVALEVIKEKAVRESRDAFLEELVVRRELSDNYCLYNDHYDSTRGFPEWAKKTLSQHMKDKRSYLYSLEDFEGATTHDDLWNAAQMEMVKRGKMHGYMRMYWAKKILEWTGSPEEAMEIAIYLNDRYELDGRDPNGYAGIAWSIGGVHDRAWNGRNVFGKIRYMSYNGCKSKFSTDLYIKWVDSL